MTFRITYPELHQVAEETFRRAGLTDADARTGADVLAVTDAWGVFTHGTKNLLGYVRRLQAGGLRPRGQPRVVSEGPAWAVVDGDSSLGMVTSVLAMSKAVAKAKENGLAYVGVRNSCHFGAAGYYAWLAAQEGLIGIAMANDIPSVAAPGSRAAITGSNPLAYAVPAGKHRPLLLDMATSTVAGGKVYAAKARGEPIPGNWIIDGEGRPTSDPSGFPKVGALLPMAGHKGYGLALLIETLSGILSGAAITWGISSWSQHDTSLHTQHGAAFLVIDVKLVQDPETFTRRVDGLIDEIHAAPRAAGVERLYVPGEMEWERYDTAMREGICLPSDVVTNLKTAVALVGLDLPGNGG
jgi:LDH2 family malate/lactate/ureidoglycolate dehydrogenase